MNLPPSFTLRKLSSRISLVGFLLTAGFMMTTGAVVYVLVVRLMSETAQQKGWTIADDIAREIQPLLTPADPDVATDTAGIQAAIHGFQRYDPNLDVYLLDAEGNIIADYARSRSSVRHTINPEPLRRFIHMGGSSPSGAIVADDPRSADETVVFSAAPLTFRDGRKGFVFATLLSDYGKRALGLFGTSASLRAFGITLFLGLLGYVAIGLYALRGITNAFGKIMQGVRFYADGAFDRVISVRRTDELGELASVLNGMAASLAEKIAELREKDRLRQELIMDIVHDLRGPAGTMGGFVELLQHGADSAPPEERAEYYQSMEKGLLQLNSLIEQLSQLNKLEIGKAKPVLMRCDPSRIVMDIVTLQERRAKAVGIRLTAEHPPAPVEVMCDPDMIRRVLTNLVENALRYTDIDGSIVIRLFPSGPDLVFEVEDTGIGISDAALPHIFERNFQVEEQQAKGQSGLGLAIVRKIIAAHGSEISVRSTEGVGTIFSFALPIA